MEIQKHSIVDIKNKLLLHHNPITGKSTMHSALIILSPLVSHQIRTDFCAATATELKKGGAARADITTDAIFAENHARQYPVPSFSNVAYALSKDVFTPIVGKSSVKDLTYTIEKYDPAYVPDLDTLKTVGTIMLKSKGKENPTAQSTNGSRLGLVFFVALYSRNADAQLYSSLVFPSLMAGDYDALTLLDKKLVIDKGSATPAIDLSGIRKTIKGICAGNNPQRLAKLN